MDHAGGAVRLLALAALALTAACAEDIPTDANAGVSGSVQFSYTGGGGGSYDVAGAIGASPTQQTIHGTNWAVGWKDDGAESVNAGANRTRDDGRSDMFALVVGRQTVGSAAISANCTSTVPACTDVLLAIGVDASSNSYEFYCRLESGAVTITAISGDNVQGTFSGSGSCVRGGSDPVTSAWVVTGGSFNVPLVVTPPPI